MPIIGQNWGAGRFGRMREGIRVGRKFGILWGLGSMVVLAVFARPVASLFSDDPEVISKIMLYLRIVPAAYFMQNVMLLITGVLNVLNRPLHAAAVGIGQVFVLTVPLAWLGSRLLGVAGIFLGIAVSYLVTGFVSQRVLASQLSAVEKEDREEMKVIGGSDACSQ